MNYRATFVWYGQFMEHWVLISRMFYIDICSIFCFKIMLFQFKANFKAFHYITVVSLSTSNVWWLVSALKTRRYLNSSHNI